MKILKPAHIPLIPLAMLIPLFFILLFSGFAGASARQGKKYAALTFDDGPTSKYTPKILEILKGRNIHATFFLVGMNAEKNPSVTRRIASQGHEIGNHSYRHFGPVPTNSSYFRHDLEMANSSIKKITGIKPVLFRPPYGQILPFEAEILKDENMQLVMWDLNPNPHPNDTEFSVEENIVFARSNFLIVLMHDNSLRGNDAVKFLPAVIQDLNSRGYEFVTTSELLRLKKKSFLN